jgi:adenylosuccinate synthase
MTKPKKLTSIKKTPRSPQTDVYVMEPSAISQATGKVTGTPTQPIYQAVPKAKNNNNSWQNLNDLSSEIGQWIASLSEEINSSVEMVKLFGCDHPAEFNAVVTNSN